MIQPAPELTTRSQTPVADKDADDAQAFAIQAARLINDLRCDDILVFDLRGLSPVTKYIVIASGTSDRQIKSIGGEVADLGAEQGFPRYGSDRDGASTWAVIDLVDVMVHLFEPATRGHYDLEMMWGDAPQIKWRRPASAPTDTPAASDSPTDQA